MFRTIYFFDYRINDLRIHQFEDIFSSSYFKYFFTAFCILILINGSYGERIKKICDYHKIKNIPFVIFTRKGNAIEKINQLHKNTNLVVFTDNKKTYTYCKFRLNTSAILLAN